MDGNSLNERTDGQSGDGVGFTGGNRYWTKLGVRKIQLNPVPAIAVGALNLTPISGASVQLSPESGGGNRAALSALRSVIAEDGKCYTKVIRKLNAPYQLLAYLTLWTMQQVVQRGTESAAKYRVCIWRVNRDDKQQCRCTVCRYRRRETVTAYHWVGRDNNQPTVTAPAADGGYQRYLANQTPTPLVLTPPEDVRWIWALITTVFVLAAVCALCRSGRTIPNTLCQQGEMMQQQQRPSGNPFDQSSQPQQPAQQQPPKKRRATCLRLDEMFGGN